MEERRFESAVCTEIKQNYHKLKTSTVQVSHLTKMESPIRTIALLIDEEGKGTLMENDEIVRENIPEYELKAFIKGL